LGVGGSSKFVSHTNYHDPRTTPSGRKVIRCREKEREKREGKKTNLVATTLATQPFYNTAWAAHALHSDLYWRMPWGVLTNVSAMPMCLHTQRQKSLPPPKKKWGVWGEGGCEEKILTKRCLENMKKMQKK
jgi:hypothetical protein